LEGLAIEDCGIFYGHFVYFTAKWYILWPFGTICGRSGYVSTLVCCTEKNLATLGWWPVSSTD
jgi:hypothetical protein